jgi:hypothetical protein
MTFDGVNDILEFATNLTVGPSSFFAVMNKITDTAGADTTFFVSREKGYLSRYGSVNIFTVYLGVGVASGMAIPTTLAIVELLDRAFNDIDMGVNGVVVNRTSGVGYPARAYAAIGADPTGVQHVNSAYAEIIFLGNAVSKTAAARIRRYLKAWHGIALA